MIPKKTIIIGATSGIGRELAKVFLQNGYAVGVTGRRTDLLKELKKEDPARVFLKTMDLARTEEAMDQFRELIHEMEGMDICVLSSGVGFLNEKLDWPKERETIEVNVAGFTAMAGIAINHFLEKGGGHLVGISSLAALRGDAQAPAYNASNAFISNYMEGLRKKAAKSGTPVVVTDIQPGFVDTAMAKGDGLFWIASPQKAARQIFTAIRRKKTHAYVTKRWRLVGWLMKALPDSLYHRL